MGVKWCLTVVLICISNNDVGHRVLCLLAICISSLKKSPFNSLAYILSLSFCYWVARILYIFWILEIYQINLQKFFSHSVGYLFTFFFKFLKGFIFLFLEGGRKKGRETSMRGCLSHAPYWGPGPQPRHTPSLGIELVTLWSLGRHSIHWTTPFGVTSKKPLPNPDQEDSHLCFLSCQCLTVLVPVPL